MSAMAAIDATDTAASRAKTHTSNLRWSQGFPVALHSGRAATRTVTIVTKVAFGFGDMPDRYPLVAVSQPSPRCRSPHGPSSRAFRSECRITAERNQNRNDRVTRQRPFGYA